MERVEKAREIRKFLDRLYPDPPIPLHHTNPFTLCIAVLLSAHTTDKSVNAATPTLFGLADNPEDMVKLGQERIREIIARVGLANTKSRNVWNLSRILLEKHGGSLPKTMEELEELPGVGHKTASVVMCQAYGVPAFPVDTHIHRLAERWGLSDGKNVEQTERDLKAVFPEPSWIKLHLQLIYYGREYCPARHHDLERCELCRRFAVAPVKAAARRGEMDEPGRKTAPGPKPKAATPRVPKASTKPVKAPAGKTGKAPTKASKAAKVPSGKTRSSVANPRVSARTGKRP